MARTMGRYDDCNELGKKIRRGIMKIDDLLTELLRLKNEGVKEVTIDPRPSKVCDRYGYLNLRDGEGGLKQKIRIIRK